MLWPSLAIATLVIGLNLFADGLNEEPAAISGEDDRVIWWTEPVEVTISPITLAPTQRLSYNKTMTSSTVLSVKG
ncbi:MAG: hypothetical protein R2911_22245 [Caldilineaceae bacterium]